MGLQFAAAPEHPRMLGMLQNGFFLPFFSYKSLLWMTDFLPPFAAASCFYQCTQRPG